MIARTINKSIFVFDKLSLGQINETITKMNQLLKYYKKASIQKQVSISIPIRLLANIYLFIIKGKNLICLLLKILI